MLLKAEVKAEQSSKKLKYDGEKDWKDSLYTAFYHKNPPELLKILSQLEHDSSQRYTQAQEILLNCWMAQVIEDILAEGELV